LIITGFWGLGRPTTPIAESGTPAGPTSDARSLRYSVIQAKSSSIHGTWFDRMSSIRFACSI
jgi:hypothetical protein